MTEDDGTTSVDFHRDGHPPYTFKLIVYLTDVAMVGPQLCRNRLKMDYSNFWDGSSEKRPTLAIKCRTLGESGTLFSFNNNALHAGGRMEVGERVVAVFVLHLTKEAGEISP